MAHPNDPEYRLYVAPLSDEMTHKVGTAIRLETSKVFASFQYELSVRETEDPPRLHLKVLGLKTPPLSLPATGHAHFSREYENLSGEIEVTVEGIEGKQAVARVKVLANQVQILQRPKGSWLEVVAAEHPPTNTSGE